MENITKPQLDHILKDISQELPIIRPISEFIHLNLLLNYQHLPFFEALKLVSDRFQAWPLPNFDFFKEKILNNEISLSEINEKVKIHDPELVHETERIIFENKTKIQNDLRQGRLHQFWNKAIGANVVQMADGLLIKWAGMYLDQGIGLWEMPDANEKTFYECIKDLLSESLIKPAPFTSGNIKDLFKPSSEESIIEHLHFLCPEWELKQEYLRESVYTLRGWCGLISTLEAQPNLIPFKRKIALKDFIALKLILEKAWINELSNNETLIPDFDTLPKSSSLLTPSEFVILRACQESLEEKTFREVLKKIETSQSSQISEPLYQAVFCMDDRECSLRRHLEGLESKLETFGTAGHFGIECLYQNSQDAFPKKHCPAPMKARFLIKEKSLVQTENNSFDHDLFQPTHLMMDGIISTITGGLKSIPKLVENLFFPMTFVEKGPVVFPATTSKLEIHNPNEKTEGELLLGYTKEQMGDLVFQQLQLIGFNKNFAPLIFIFGHGSNSTNNPYFTTYGCGACSGRPGSANARIFCEMANDPEVRTIIQNKYDLHLPDKTRFIASFHDTTRDIVEIYGTDLLDKEILEKVNQFSKNLKIALFKNARERSKMFKLCTYNPVSFGAHKEVLRRSYSLFETRPEMGHTNVAFSIVGRRAFTKSVNLNRRAFLQSYDPTIDPEGMLLATSLGAVIPVTSGIGLDYFFSRVDNSRFGAGSKLPQNIVGNLGVSHGTESDLLVGLPYQMIDQHTPQRLLILVEQRPDIALKAIKSNPLVYQIVSNQWVHYYAWDGETKKYYAFDNGEMKQKDLGGSQSL